MRAHSFYQAKATLFQTFLRKKRNTQLERFARAQEEDARLLNCFFGTKVDVRGNRKIDFDFINYFASFD
jgi:hypothetical protein